MKKVLFLGGPLDHQVLIVNDLKDMVFVALDAPPETKWGSDDPLAVKIDMACYKLAYSLMMEMEPVYLFAGGRSAHDQ